MQYFNNLLSFSSNLARRIGLLTRFANPRVAAVALLMAAVATGALLRSHVMSGQARGPHPESALAGAQGEQAVLPPGLSRQRKGFSDAIAELESAAQHSQHLSAYYDRVIRRTKGQCIASEATTCVHSNGKRERPVGQPVSVPPGASSDNPKGPSPEPPPINVTVPLGGEPASAVSSADVKPGAGGANVVASSNGSSAGSQAPVPPVAAGPALSDPGEAASAPRPACLVAGDISFDLNPAIDRWVSYYTGTRIGRSTMQQGLARCEAYLDTSRAEFKKSGLPEDLVWVAQVESVWKQGAYSRVAAGGIWQFMPATAADYGLVVGSPADERFDPAKETQAAATYLRDLYTLFGNWELALAAYNCGEPRLMDAIVQDGKPDFWELYDKRLLPRETCNYVPKILAAIKVASDPETYGFAIDPTKCPEAEAPGALAQGSH